MLRVRSRLLKPVRSGAALVVGVAFASCENTYPLAPTPCDDYCLATQRANCDDDYPDECVAECEAALYPHDAPQCNAFFAAWTRCLEDAADDSFICIAERSRPRRGVCHVEQIELYACSSTTASLCYDFCSRMGATCPERPISFCVVDCSNWFEICADPAAAYLDCAVADEVSCAAEVETCRSPRNRLFECLGE